MAEAVRALRAAVSPTSPSKRRHSPPPEELLTGPGARSDDPGDAASPPPSKRGLFGFSKGFLQAQ